MTRSGTRCGTRRGLLRAALLLFGGRFLSLPGPRSCAVHLRCLVSRAVFQRVCGRSGEPELRVGPIIDRAKTPARPVVALVCVSTALDCSLFALYPLSTRSLPARRSALCPLCVVLCPLCVCVCPPFARSVSANVCPLCHPTDCRRFSHAGTHSAGHAQARCSSSARRRRFHLYARIAAE